ncbi:BspA family leucine-rich repeat surface protein [bacterium]|nr:BspA family leucine-rich repeat surface protein [bacterium]
MFYQMNGLTNVDLSSFDTSRVTNMSYMFYNCRSLKKLDLSNFNTSKVTNMNYMFSSCSALETIYASSSFVVSPMSINSTIFSSDMNLM